MSPVEELHKAAWQILCEIQQEQLATPNNEWIIIDTGADVRERAVRVLAKTGSIKALEYQASMLATLRAIQKLNGVYSKPTAYKVEPLSPRFEEIFALYESVFNHEYNEDEIKVLTNQVQVFGQSANQTAEPNGSNLSTADHKKLFILEKLKEEWDLTPKTDSEPVTFQAGMKARLRLAGETKVSSQKFNSWMRESGITDWYELENILNILQQEGLISKFRIIGAAR